MKSYKKFVKHNLNADQLDHSFGGFCQVFVVDSESSKILQPGKRPFDNPPFWKDSESTGALVWSEDNFDNPSELVGNPIPGGALIPSIRKYLSQAGKLVFRFPYDPQCPFAVMQTGLMYRDRHRNAKRVNHNVFLATLDLLVPVSPLSEST